MRVEVPEILRDLSENSDAAKLLKSYYYSTSQTRRALFSGSRFNTLGHSAAGDAKPDEFCPADIAAVLCLGVRLKGDAVVDLLECRKDAVRKHLGELRQDADLWDPDQVDIEQKGGHASELWRLLREVVDIGPVKTSKLMARKRPRLIPIYDKWVGSVLRLESSEGYWTKYRDLMLTEEDGVPLHVRLQDLIVEAGLSEAVTPLRACDVILWYWANRRQGIPRNEVLGQR